jgi:hypothetical protein
MSMLPRLLPRMPQIGYRRLVSRIVHHEWRQQHRVQPHCEGRKSAEEEHAILPLVRRVRRIECPALAVPGVVSWAGEIETPVAFCMSVSSRVSTPTSELGFEGVGRERSRGGGGTTASEVIICGGDRLESGMPLGWGDVAACRCVGVMRTDEVVVYSPRSR